MIEHEEAFRQAFRQMEARRQGTERSFLLVTFLHKGRVVEEKILEQRYACRKMEAWTARGPEFKVRNRPVELPRGGVGVVMHARRRRATATRFLNA